MRLLVIKQASDLQALSTKLLIKKPGGTATLDRLKALNPHVDFKRIEAGTVLLLPDTPDVKADDKDTRSVAGDAFEECVKHTAEGFKSVAERVSRASKALAVDRAAVNAVLKTAAVKRQIESDPLLKTQLDKAGEQSNAEQKRIQEAAKHVETMQKVANEEMAALGNLLR